MSNYTRLLDLYYPVGSIYISVVDIMPDNIFGGTWTKITGTINIGDKNCYAWERTS